MLTAILNRLTPSRRPTNARRDARPRRPEAETMEERLLLSNYARISASNVVEGSGGGTTAMVFKVSLMAPAAGDVKIDYATAGLTATAGQDFNTTQGTLVIPSGQKIGTITVPVVADNVVESNEFFRVNLSNPRNAVLIGGSATGVILDDDTQVAPDLAINNVTIRRGLSGSKTMTFEVALSTTPSSAVSVRASTENLTAIAGRDFEAKSEVLTFAPGQRVKKFTVKVYGTSTPTSPKVFGVRLTDASVSIRKSLGFGTLIYGA